MCNNGFLKCQVDHYCYVKNFNYSYIILLVYIDDMLIAGPCIEYIYKLKKELSKEFSMKYLGAMKQILGMRISKDKVSRTLKL